MLELATRLANRVQMTTDGHRVHPIALRGGELYQEIDIDFTSFFACSLENSPVYPH
jgi:hypothetical protein